MLWSSVGVTGAGDRVVATLAVHTVCIHPVLRHSRKSHSSITAACCVDLDLGIFT